jgi:ribonuclease Z
LHFESPELIFEDEALRVSSVPLRHSVPCYGFLFEEKPLPRKIIREALDRYGVPSCDIHRLRKGEDWLSPEGVEVPNDRLTEAPRPPFRYAFCTDTAYLPELAEWVEGVDLLYHESTFLKSEEALALKTFHSTAEQAARIALSAQVGRLLLGHYSVRYEDRSVFLAEARPIFPNTLLAEDGLVVEG